MSTPNPNQGGTRRPLEGGTPPRSTARAPQAPMRHGGRPANGRHVESAAPGQGPYDYSGAVGSNVTPATGAQPSAASEVLEALPWSAAYPTASMTNPPMF